MSRNFTCSSCGTSFLTSKGLSQHEWRLHAGDYHSGLLIVNRTENKRRWSMDEKVLLAREEVRITCGESPTELGVNAALCIAPFSIRFARKGMDQSRCPATAFCLKWVDLQVAVWWIRFLLTFSSRVQLCPPNKPRPSLPWWLPVAGTLMH